MNENGKIENLFDNYFINNDKIVMIDIEHLKWLADNRQYSELNKLVMTDTLEMCENNPDLVDAVRNSISKQFIVFENDELSLDNTHWDTKIIVSRKRTYEAAKAYQWQKVAVLDFANYYSVWWAPFSAWAQEESMCRCSTLYSCISTADNKEKYYKKHRKEREVWDIDNYGWDDIIYVPEVVVFKTDVSLPELLDKSEWYKTDVILAAAPELWHWYLYIEEVFKSAIKKRIKRILDVAYKEKVDVLVLWAFWCWAFENPPEIVAQVFKEELENYDFKIVEFAIHSRARRPNENFEIFDRVFNGNISYNLTRFHEAQEGVYEIAKRELIWWRKESHWMRYIFPQIKWLWYSENARYYAIKDLWEAKAYYNDKILRDRLLELCNIILNLQTNEARDIFWWIDSMKLHSCITLFHKVDQKNQIFIDVLKKYYHWELDEKTLDIIEE